MTASRHCIVLGMIGGLAVAASAAAQAREWEEPPALEQRDEPLTFKLYGGGLHQFDTDIDAGGGFEVTRLNVGVLASWQAERDLKVSLNFGYQFSDYKFSKRTSIGSPEPWDEIHTFRFGAILAYMPANDWTVFGGPVLEFARESSADSSESWTGGGIIGVSVNVSPGLTLGGGLGITSQLEAGTRAFPVFSIDWELTDDLRLSSTAPGIASTLTGLELVWDLGGGWETAVGGGYEYHRFRLDDEGPSPDGVGEDNSIPIWVRLSYTSKNNDFTASFLTGVAAAGSVELIDNDGTVLGDEDYDPAPFLGASFSFKF